MPQIIYQDNPGGDFGRSLGTGLGSGLSQLAQMKLNQLSQREGQVRASKGLQALGFSPEDAFQISQFDPNTIAKIAQEKTRANQRRATTAPGLQSIVPGLSSEEAAKIGELPPGLQLEYYRNFLKNTPEFQEEQNTAQAAPAQTGVSQQGLGALNRVNQFLNPQQQLQQQQPANIPEQVTPVQENIPTKPKTIAEQALKAGREKAKTKEQKIEQARADKETQKYYEQIKNEYKGAINGNKRLDQIEKLTKEGNLGVPLLNALLKLPQKIGIDLSGIMTADAQELEKLSNDFIKDAKQYFGSRLTDQDLAAFMKTIPSLAQSNQGRLRIIGNLRAFNEAAILRKKAADQIIRENNGHRPGNFEEQIEDRIGEELDNLAGKFVQPDVPPKILGSKFLGHLGEGTLTY